MRGRLDPEEFQITRAGPQGDRSARKLVQQAWFLARIGDARPAANGRHTRADLEMQSDRERMVFDRKREVEPGDIAFHHGP
jgi:hypothetical protein